MTENKSCSNCKHSKNVRISTGSAENIKYWSCDEIPGTFREFESETAFETFSCSLWADVFESLRNR